MKKHFLNTSIIFFLFCNISCKKDIPTVDNLNNGNVIILGHRGMGKLYKYPGNTWESISPLIKIGADGAEVDIQMTKDSVLVLYHHADLDDKTSCNNSISDYTWAEISECTFYSFSDHIYLISVDNLFSRLSNLESLYFSFDCKLNTNVPNQDVYTRTFARSVIQVCSKYNMASNVFIEGEQGFLKTLQEEGAQNKLFVSSGTTIHTSIEQAKSINAYGVVVSANSVTADDVKKAHNNGLYVMMWGMQTHGENKNAIAKNPDIVQTDKPINMLKMFHRYKK